MNKYSQVAILAAEKASRDCEINPIDAWDKSAAHVFGLNSSSCMKNCPKSAFLGLCEMGFVAGFATGNYTRSTKNKAYALKAREILRDGFDGSATPESLWEMVMEGEMKVHNHQMDVVLALWHKGYLR